MAPRLHSVAVRSAPMLDLIFILVTVGFFVLAVAYTRGCERL